MKKKIYLAPDIEVVDVEMETILAGSDTYTDQTNDNTANNPGGSTSPGNTNTGNSDIFGDGDDEW